MALILTPANFRESPFGNCGVPCPSEVVLSLSVRNGTTVISLPFRKFSSFQSRISRKQLREIEKQMVSAISFGWSADFGIPSEQRSLRSS